MTVYADNAATTQMSRAAIDAMLPYKCGDMEAGAILFSKEYGDYNWRCFMTTKPLVISYICC